MTTTRSQRPTLTPLLPQDTASDRLVPGIQRLASLLELLDDDSDFFARLLDLADHVMHDPDDAPVARLCDLGRDDPRIGRLLLDRVVPALARRLGDEWARDALSFADVTVASVRLQSLVRRVEPPAIPGQGDAIVLVVPPWEQHTLAGLLVARQIRAQGVPVKACIGFDADVVARMAETGGTVGFLISIGSIQSLERLPNYLGRMKQTLTCLRPIVIGGPAVDGTTGQAQQYGGDHFATDAADALRLCGVTVDPVARSGQSRDAGAAG